MNYGKAIRVARTTRGRSQKWLALACGMDPSSISLIERGARQPSTSTLDAITKALRIPPYLLQLLGAEKEELRQVSPEHAALLGRELLNILGDPNEGSVA